MKAKGIFRGLLAALMIGMGVLHLVVPKPFIDVMPAYLHIHAALVLVSGIGEILCGFGILMPHIRRLSGWVLIALLIAVFPANVDMAIHPRWTSPLALTLLWVRLPFQGVLIAWAWWVSQPNPRRSSVV